MTSYLFVALAPAPFGEAVRGLEIATAAHADGDGVAFLHRRALEPLFAGAPFSRGVIDDTAQALDAAIRDTVAARRVDVVVLVDAVSTYGTLGHGGLRRLVHTCGATVVALDLWSCDATDLVWDMGDAETRIDPFVLQIPALRPAPVCRPEAPGAYRGLPAAPPGSPTERERVRAELGISAHEQVVFMATAAWQSARRYPPGFSRRLASAWPGAFDLVCRRLGAIRIVHVGPEPLAIEHPQIHVPPVSGREFGRLLAASDLVITNNVMATSIATAIAADVPVLVLRNTFGGATVDEVVAARGAPLARDAAAWLSGVLPVAPYSVCPLGLHAFLAPVLAANPYCDAIDLAEVLDPDASAEQARALIAGDGAVRRAAYRSQIAALPSGLERLRALGS